MLKVEIFMILLLIAVTIIVSFKKFRKNRSMHNKLFLSYLVFIIIIISFITYVTYSISSNIIINNVGKSRAEVLSRTADNINSLTYSVTLAVSLHSFNNELDKLLSKPLSNDPYEKLIKKRKAKKMFGYYLDAFEKLDLSYYMVIYGYNGFRFSTIEDSIYQYNYEMFSKREWDKEVVKNNGKILWVSTYNDKDIIGEDRYIFTAARLLKDLITNKPLGILYLNVDESVLYNTYKKSINEYNDIYILDEENKIVSSKEKEKLGTSIKYLFDMENKNIEDSKNYYIKNINGKKFLVSYNYLKKTGWKIIEVTPLESLLKPIQNKMIIFLWLLLFCILISTVFSYLIAKRMTNPIKELSNTMKKIGAGDLSVRFQYKDEVVSNEIRELSTGFNNMIDDIHELLISVKKEEKLKSEAEIKYLQAQINPHFLYNTLNSIRCLIAMDKNKEADIVMKKLISFLRKMLNLEEIITLAEEFNNIDDYITIEKYKYDNFNVNFKIEDDLYHAYVPKLILQPLVENAIFHGLGQKQGDGNISITASKEENKLVIKIIDDGIGISKQKIIEINNNLNNKTKDKSGHIGLANVHQRIVQKYGEEYGLRIKSQKNNGTEVRVILPLKI